ncbi:DUF2218 domain-containing protein [Streptomyces sp. NPDC005374]|uniref:DUF2218 domain-containing protein n=1 Tax=Streptomyces sp. NPDC005374 TaxID=3364713 RepID=UPI003692BA7D
MPSIEAHIDTARAGRYLVQLCRHAAAMSEAEGHRSGRHGDATAHGPDGGGDGHVQVRSEWSDTRGVIEFAPHGRCAVDATGTGLDVRIDATDEGRLVRIRQIITEDLDRFGRRDGLVVNWSRIEGAGTA